MSDPIQDAIDRTLGARKPSPLELLEEAQGLLRQAREEIHALRKERDAIQGQLDNYIWEVEQVRKQNKRMSLDMGSLELKCRKLKDEVNLLRRVPSWVRRVFHAA